MLNMHTQMYDVCISQMTAMHACAVYSDFCHASDRWKLVDTNRSVFARLKETFISAKMQLTLKN